MSNFKTIQTVISVFFIKFSYVSMYHIANLEWSKFLVKKKKIKAGICRAFFQNRKKNVDNIKLKNYWVLR